MLCPYCSHDNVDGEDLCAECGQDLTNVEFDGDPVERDILETTLAELGPRPAVVVPPDATVAQVVARLHAHTIGCVLVGGARGLEGVFSERDLLLRVGVRYDEVANAPISEFMTPRPETLEAATPIAFALNRMSIGDFRHLPIVSDERLVGVISMRDVLSHVCDGYPELIDD